MHPALENCLAEVRNCERCAGICHAIGPYGTNIALNYIEPIVPTEVVFVAESPPDKKGNFFYEPAASDTRFRNRLFELIEKAGLKPVKTVCEFTARGYYLADAINCGWNKNEAAARQPTPKKMDEILGNCLGYLETQLRYLRPKSVVFMGKLSEKAVDSEFVSRILTELKIPEERIVKMPFITTAPVKTDSLVEKLKPLAGIGRDL